MKRDYQACFCNKSDPQFVAAVSALQALDNSENVIGCVLAQQRDGRLAEEGYVGTDDSIRRLVGKRRVPWSNDPNVMPNEPPGDDHGNLYLKDGKPALYLSQHYALTYEKLQAVVKFCERWGLEASIDGLQSTWFPGLTIAIRYEAKKGCA
jgi:hypothetical protein